ncbi:hypothetical protein D1872_318350 [compost metagenome]
MVGSSIISRAGFASMACAKSTRCRIPLENVPTALCRLSSSPTSARASCTLAAGSLRKPAQKDNISAAVMPCGN